MIELRHKINYTELIRSYKRQSFGYDNAIPTFDDIYDDLLEAMFIVDRNQNVMTQIPEIPQKIIVLNALLENGVAFILDRSVKNQPMKVVW